MRRMLAIILLLIFVAVVPAQAAVGKAAVASSAQVDALNAAKALHGLSVASGASFSFLSFVPDADSSGACAAASALYLALRESNAVSFDELSYNADGSGILVNAGHDLRFTNLASGTLHIAYSVSGDDLVCSVSIDESAASESAMHSSTARKNGNSVSILCDDDPALLNNIALAAGSLYDTTLATGNVLSFNAITGPTAAQYGYQPASDGRGSIVCGGGTDIVASALWLLIQDHPDFVVVQKTNYGKSYNQTYVETSADAILTDYASAADFSFRYTGKSSVTFYTMLEENVLTVIME